MGLVGWPADSFKASKSAIVVEVVEVLWASAPQEVTDRCGRRVMRCA